MLEWAGRAVTFITNCLVLLGYMYVYNWLQRTHFTRPSQRRLVGTYMAVLTISFLLLFHVASLISMAQANNHIGFGWTYISFQIATVLYALLTTKRTVVFDSTAITILVWYVWMPNTRYALPVYLISLIMMFVAFHWGPRITRHALYYFAFAFIFNLPFLLTNYVSLRGINVGWQWEIITCLVITTIVWFTQCLFDRHSQRQRHLMRAARIDDLTKIRNFRVFNEDLQAAYERCRVDNQAYGIYTLDIDHFKEVNDQYGHLVGNIVLKRVAAKLQELVKEIVLPATVYRTGGEEFSFIVTSSHPDDQVARDIARMIHDELGTLTFDDADYHFSITVSLGQDRLRASDANYLEAYRRADQYLYESKRSGRNTVTVAGVVLTDDNDSENDDGATIAAPVE